MVNKNRIPYVPDHFAPQNKSEFILTLRPVVHATEIKLSDDYEEPAANAATMINRWQHSQFDLHKQDQHVHAQLCDVHSSYSVVDGKTDFY